MALETKIELKYRPKSVWFFRYGVKFLWNSWVAFSFSQEGKLVGFCDVHAKPIISKHRISIGRYQIKPKKLPLRSIMPHAHELAWHECLLACLINRKINERLLSTVVKVGFTAEEEVEIYENPLLYQKKAIILTVTVLHYAPVQKELLTQQLNQEVSVRFIPANLLNNDSRNNIAACIHNYNNVIRELSILCVCVDNWIGLYSELKCHTMLIARI